MSFAWPLVLLALLAVPLLLGLRAHRRPAARTYPVAFTNLELLAGVVEQAARPWRRWVPLVLLLLALDVRGGGARAAAGAPHGPGPERDRRAARRRLGLDARERRRADASRRRARRDADVPRQAAVAVQGRPRLVQLRADVLAQPTSDRDSRSATRSPTSSRRPATAIGDGLTVAVQLIKHAMRARRGRAQEGRGPAGGDRAPVGRGAEPRHRAAAAGREARARRPGSASTRSSLGTPNGKVTFGFGAFMNKIPVPPDPGDDADDRADDGRQGLHGRRARSSLAKIYQSLGSSLGRRRKLEEITSWFAAAAALLLVGAVATGTLLDGRLP